MPSRRRPSPEFFPPEPKGIRGRTTELRTLARLFEPGEPVSVALVGSGGSGKSMLAAALAYRVASRFAGTHWFRIGAWDVRTLTKMLALRFGLATPSLAALRRFLRAEGPRLFVLDNHEDDVEAAKLLDGLADSGASFVLTARRCLLGGVTIFPVVAPLVTEGRSAFPRVRALTRLLRSSPLALDVADAIVSARRASVERLGAFLEQRGVRRIRAVEHEDDSPEIAALLDFVWPKLSGPSQRALGALAMVDGDHVDPVSLGVLAELGGTATRALAPLRTLHLVQEPLPGRFALHAVVRHAVRKRTPLDPRRQAARALAHYAAMLEREPSRFALEQTHYFAAMDFAQVEGNMATILRLDEIGRKVEGPAVG